MRPSMPFHRQAQDLLGSCFTSAAQQQLALPGATQQQQRQVCRSTTLTAMLT